MAIPRLNLQTILFFILFVAILCVYFFLRPALKKKEGVDMVITILQNWQAGEYDKNFYFWENKSKVPPISQVTSYTILKSGFKKSYGKHRGEVFVRIDFASTSRIIMSLLNIAKNKKRLEPNYSQATGL